MQTYACASLSLWLTSSSIPPQKLEYAAFPPKTSIIGVITVLWKRQCSKVLHQSLLLYLHEYKRQETEGIGKLAKVEAIDEEWVTKKNMTFHFKVIP